MNNSGADAQRWLDGVAIAGSLACMVHCLAFPLIIALLPALTSWLTLPESFHLWVVLTAAPFSTLVLWQHSLRRGRRTPFVMGIAGLSVMAWALNLEGHSLEPFVTSAGALVLAGAHILNWRGGRPCRA